MKAKQENIVNNDRHNLVDVIPLRTPYSMFIDVCNACNFKCKFCAIQYSKRRLTFPKISMKYDDYVKVIDDICGFGTPLKMLRLTANGEPLINKDLPQMIEYAKRRKVTEHIEIVTNASLLTHEMSLALINAGLDRIRISIEAIDAQGYYDISGVRLDWKKFVEEIRFFYDNRKQCEVYIKTVDAAIKSKQDEELFYKEFGDICDRIFVEHVIPIWTGYEEINDDFKIENVGLHGHEVKDVKVCPFPFYSFVVNPDGEITVCCNDWERKISMGNAFEESVVDVWRGDRYRKFLMGMIKNGRKRNHPQGCAKCLYPCYDAVDNLDKDIDKLLQKFGNQ